MSGHVCPIGLRAFHVRWTDDDGVNHHTVRWANYAAQAREWLQRNHPTSTGRKVKPWFASPAGGLNPGGLLNSEED